MFIRRSILMQDWANYLLVDSLLLIEGDAFTDSNVVD